MIKSKNNKALDRSETCMYIYTSRGQIALAVLQFTGRVTYAAKRPVRRFPMILLLRKEVDALSEKQSCSFTVYSPFRTQRRDMLSVPAAIMRKADPDSYYGCPDSYLRL